MLIPSFDDGTILKKQMLVALRDFPRKALDIFFSKYGDGIISGLDLSVEGDVVIISPGIFKFCNKVYLVEDKLPHVELCEGNNFVYLEPVISETDSGQMSSISATVSKEQHSEKFELFRCTKVKDSVINIFKDLDDVFSKPLNHINQNNVLFSYCGGSSFSRNYLKIYALNVLKSYHCSSFDVAFACHCLNGLHDLDLIAQYFGFSDKIFSNEDIICMIKEKVEQLNSNGKQKIREKADVYKTEKRMVID